MNANDKLVLVPSLSIWYLVGSTDYIEIVVCENKICSYFRTKRVCITYLTHIVLTTVASTGAAARAHRHGIEHNNLPWAHSTFTGLMIGIKSALYLIVCESLVIHLCGGTHGEK
jgi:hypothetical protein